MSDSGKVIQVTDRNVEEVVGAERSVLVFAKSDCGHCTAYQSEIEALLERGEMGEIPVGKMVLDQRGVMGFKRDNPWLSGLRFLPHTVLYREGRPVDDFAASKGSYLRERIEDAFAQG